VAIFNTHMRMKITQLNDGCIDTMKITQLNDGCIDTMKITQLNDGCVHIHEHDIDHTSITMEITISTAITVTNTIQSKQY
jgi:hypothetical protein